MKRIVSIIITLFVCSSFLFAQQKEFRDTTAANNAGRYQSQELLKQKQTDYKAHKIIIIAKNAIKINGTKNNKEWYMIDSAPSEYGTKIDQGFKEEHSADFEYETVKAKDGFDTEYTLYKKQTSDWNTQLDKKGWKVKKSDAGEDCVEVKVKKTDDTEGVLYGKLDEIAETKNLFSQGYLSKSKKESGTEYSDTTIVVNEVQITLYKKKIVENPQNNDSSTNPVTTTAPSTSTKATKQEKPATEEPSSENNDNQAKIDSLNNKIEQMKSLLENNSDTNGNNEELQRQITALQQQIQNLKTDEDDYFKYVYILVVLLVFIVVAFLFFKNKKSKTVETTVNNQPQHPTVTQQTPPAPTVVTPTPQPAPVPPIPQSAPQPKPMPAAPTENIAFAKDADEWIVIGASITGNGHIATKTPCQDSHKYEYLGESWGIAVTSDGAGSAANSHYGSKIVVERAVAHFKNLIIGRNWIKKNELPTETEWSQIAFAALKSVRDDLAAFAQKQNIELKSLYATAIVIIHTPDGILATHIGDGRAGYRNQQGEWKALLTPHKGEEANQTIFVPSDFWDIPAYKMSGALVPESVVIKEKPFAFTLMSDGCENTSWLCNQQDEKTGKFFDPNKPYPNFFNPLDETLQSFRKNKVSQQERAEKWKKFIESGNNSLVKEQDDKTMILGVLYM